MSNGLFYGNLFPGQPVSCFTLQDSGGGFFWMTFNASAPGTYPSNPSSITPATPFALDPRGGDSLLVAAVSLDMNAGAPTKQPIFTVPASRRLYISKVLLYGASISLTTASVGFGFNAAATDVIADATHTGLTGATAYEYIPAKAGAVYGAPGAIFGMSVNTPQGAAATALATAFGFYIAV